MREAEWAVLSTATISDGIARPAERMLHMHQVEVAIAVREANNSIWASDLQDLESPLHDIAPIPGDLSSAVGAGAGQVGFTRPRQQPPSRRPAVQRRRP